MIVVGDEGPFRRCAQRCEFSIVPIRDHDKGVGIVSKNRRHSLLNSPDHADAAILTPPLEDELLAWKGGKGSRRQAVIV